MRAQPCPPVQRESPAEKARCSGPTLHKRMDRVAIGSDRRYSHTAKIIRAFFRSKNGSSAARSGLQPRSPCVIYFQSNHVCAIAVPRNVLRNRRLAAKQSSAQTGSCPVEPGRKRDRTAQSPGPRMQPGSCQGNAIVIRSLPSVPVKSSHGRCLQRRKSLTTLLAKRCNRRHRDLRLLLTGPISSVIRTTSVEEHRRTRTAEYRMKGKVKHLLFFRLSHLDLTIEGCFKLPPSPLPCTHQARSVAAPSRLQNPFRITSSPSSTRPALRSAAE